MKQYVKHNFSDAISERELAHKEIAYRAACEGIVLLENRNILPIKSGKIALFGTGARHTIKGGSGSGEVNERHSISIYEGMIDAGYEITSNTWLDKYDLLYQGSTEYTAEKLRREIRHAKPGEMASIVLDAAGNSGFPQLAVTDNDIENAPADAAVYVVSRQAGEGTDRHIEKGDNDLTFDEISSLERMVKAYKKVILIINIGSSINMNFLSKIPELGAVIYFCQQGTEGGHALADIISGKVNPSGKLTDTWAKKYSDIPFSDEYSYLNGDLKNEYYKEGILVGYRYFDSYGIEPQYPFGYGLSYTTFDIKKTAVEIDKTKVKIKIAVTNTGSYSGKEVVQAYITAPNGILKKEYQSLVGFIKTGMINPQETEHIEISFDLSDCASYQELGARSILEAGEYIIRVGNCSAKTMPFAVLTLKSTVVVEQLKNICPAIHDFDELEIPDHPSEDFSKIQHIALNSHDFKTIIHDYSAPKPYHDSEVDDIVDRLSLKEKAMICIGGGLFSGNRTIKIEGAVGHSTHKLMKKNGLPSVEFADGPAGLRLTRYSGVYPNGKTKMKEGMLSYFNLLPNGVKKMIFANPDKSKTAYQYTTAFPVEVAQAQTWNTDLLYEIGCAVSKEMVEFGITYWLAPALNIHRNPLCGRNFEYYSEDPFLSGKCACAVIKGVQSIPGNYVAAKHFCCNNQEDGRNFVSSNVKERALREIYLKGFRIAVEEGKATGVMTSYNKVNGVNPPNSYDLCTSVLRNEWGFDGIVMTDWFASVFNGSPILSMKARNDIAMPGIPTQALQIVIGTKLSFVHEIDVERCCRNIVRQVVHSNAVKQIKEGKFTEVK